MNLQRRRTAVRFAFPIQPEQNHDNRAPKSLVQGIDFLRKSILCRFGLGYVYRDFAIGFARPTRWAASVDAAHFPSLALQPE